MEAIQQQMVEAKKNERTNVLKELKRLFKEFDFTARMLKGALVRVEVKNEIESCIISKQLADF